MPSRAKRERFIFASDLNLVKSYTEYDICIENFISSFGRKDVILYNKNIGFELMQYKDFCPIHILDDPYCLDLLYTNENQRGKGHGKRLMKPTLNYSQLVLHTLGDSLGFFEHISKDLGLEKINTCMPFGNSFISSNLNINRQPIVNSCLGGCGRKFSGYKR